MIFSFYSSLPNVSPIGARGGTRTHTSFYGQEILSLQRIPFRHPDWRPGGDSNPCMAVLQTAALPLRHLAVIISLSIILFQQSFFNDSGILGAAVYFKAYQRSRSHIQLFKKRILEIEMGFV